MLFLNNPLLGCNNFYSVVQMDMIDRENDVPTFFDV